MTILKRNGRYHFDFWYRGQRYRGTCGAGCKSLMRARQIEAEKRAEVIERGEWMLRKAPFLCDFAKRFLEYVDANEELKPRTRECYHYGVKLLLATGIAKRRLDHIGTADTSVLAFPGGPSPANQALRTLRRLLSYACEVRALRTAPRINLRKEQGREAIIEPWVEALLLEHASPALRDVITIMLDCGMRPEEVGRMRWEDIRWGDNVILVERGKSSQARRFVGLTERMRRTLEAAKQRSKSAEWVFPSDAEGGHIKWFTQSWARTVKRAEKAAGKPLPEGLVLYSARHTFATQFLRNGGDIGQLMRLMGHSSLLTTQRYLHMIEAGGTAAIMDRNNQAKQLKIVKKRA